MFKIRVHHLLCMQGFQGYGYSQEFVNNIKSIIDFIKNNEGTTIKVVARCDLICSSCPNKNQAKWICVKKEEERIIKEKALAKFLGINLEKIYKITSLFDSINQKITSKEIAKSIYCGECMWLDKCLWYQSRK